MIFPVPSDVDIPVYIFYSPIKNGRNNVDVADLPVFAATVNC